MDSQTYINGNSSKIEYLAEQKKVIQAEMIAKKMTHLNKIKKKRQSKLGCWSRFVF
jgi:hypothetical protein